MNNVNNREFSSSALQEELVCIEGEITKLTDASIGMQTDMTGLVEKFHKFKTLCTSWLNRANDEMKELKAQISSMQVSQQETQEAVTQILGIVRGRLGEKRDAIDYIMDAPPEVLYDAAKERQIDNDAFEDVCRRLALRGNVRMYQAPNEPKEESEDE